MTWQVEFTDEFEEWWDHLPEDEQGAIVAEEEFLEEHGPALGRPFVDTVKQSRHKNMKEPAADGRDHPAFSSPSTRGGRRSF